jgi:MtrB/PioB family decaheme-associated outer membrane protein
MKRTTRFMVASLGFALVSFMASSTWAQIDVGDYTISGSAEVDALPRGFSGDRSKFETYRDIPESVVVPQLELMIGGKKEDFYLDLNAGHVGRDDQNYRLRFGRYGLLDVELEWDQIPSTFNIDNARTPFIMKGGTYTLRSRPTADDATTFSNWINDPNTTRGVDLKLFDQIGKISIRYTPKPGWTFTAKYRPQLNVGKGAIAFPIGSGSSSGIAELAQPIDYQTHNMELGGEYAGKGWSLGLKYNGSLFYNDTSTLVFDNPAGIGPNCVDSTTINYTTLFGPCRARADLYPNNQAHTFTLTGTASLPLKTHFLGTVSYGWRLQNDSFLPFTINACYTGGPCAQASQVMPTLSRDSLNGDKRPVMVNLTMVNNSIDNLNLKTYYRFYSLDNRTSPVSTTATVRNDQGTPGSDWTTANFYAYSTNTAGVDAGYNLTRWLTGKFHYDWQRTHRSINDIAGPNAILNADEFKIGPTFDIRPLSWILLRAAYQHSWRFDPGYHESREMFWLTKRNQNKVSLFTDVSKWETLSFHAGFDYTNDNYPDVDVGVHNVQNVSPSIGLLYAPIDWLKFFADYNYDRYNWSQRYNTAITSSGKEKVNTFSLGMDMDVIKKVLAFHVEYQFSQGLSKINNKNNGVADPNWPASTNTWQQLLTRLEYQVHKNISLQLGYYFNKYHSKDYGVDIMQLWMGNFDNNSGQLRSVYLGNQFKGSYTANIALLGLKFKF